MPHPSNSFEVSKYAETKIPELRGCHRIKRWHGGVLNGLEDLEELE
jgi:hypothetical protein